MKLMTAPQMSACRGAYDACLRRLLGSKNPPHQEQTLMLILLIRARVPDGDENALARGLAYDLLKSPQTIEVLEAIAAAFPEASEILYKVEGQKKMLPGKALT